MTRDGAGAASAAARVLRPSSALRWVWAVVALVAGVSTALLTPHVLAHSLSSQSPDAIFYLGTAYNWVEGRGFVAQVVYSYYLTGLHPPAPAFALGPPVLPVLLAAVLWLGGASLPSRSATSSGRA